MCVSREFSQGRPGSHITRFLSEARGTFLLPEGTEYPSKRDIALSRSMNLKGYWGSGLKGRTLDARLGGKREAAEVLTTQPCSKTGEKHRTERSCPVSSLAKCDTVSITPTLSFV